MTPPPQRQRPRLPLLTYRSGLGRLERGRRKAPPCTLATPFPSLSAVGCVKASVLLALGALPPGLPLLPIPFLAGAAQLPAGHREVPTGGSAPCPVHGAGRCRAACLCICIRACSGSSPPGEGCRVAPTLPHRAPLLPVCSGGGRLWGRLLPPRKGLLREAAAPALAEAVLLAQSVCVQGASGHRLDLGAGAEVRLLGNQERLVVWAAGAPQALPCCVCSHRMPPALPGQRLSRRRLGSSLWMPANCIAGLDPCVPSRQGPSCHWVPLDSHPRRGCQAGRGRPCSLAQVLPVLAPAL